MTEATVDIRECDFSNLDLSGKVLSGVRMQVRGESAAWGAGHDGSPLRLVSHASVGRRGRLLRAPTRMAPHARPTTQGSNFAGSKLVGSQFARAQAQGANLRGVDLTDVNAFATAFDGADLEGAQFENSVLSNATFGQYEGR